MERDFDRLWKAAREEYETSVLENLAVRAGILLGCCGSFAEDGCSCEREEDEAEEALEAVLEEMRRREEGHDD